jgi:hypothetical protein
MQNVNGTGVHSATCEPVIDDAYAIKSWNVMTGQRIPQIREEVTATPEEFPKLHEFLTWRKNRHHVRESLRAMQDLLDFISEETANREHEAALELLAGPVVYKGRRYTYEMREGLICVLQTPVFCAETANSEATDGDAEAASQDAE